MKKEQPNIYERLGKLENAIHALTKCSAENPRLRLDDSYYMHLIADTSPVSYFKIELNKEVLLAALLVEKSCLEEELKERLNND